MANRGNYELTRPDADSGYTPAPSSLVVTQQPRPTATVNIVSWWGLLEAAAQRIYGGSIRSGLNNNVNTKTQLDELVEDLQFTVVHSEPQPRQTKQTIIDISTKEFINRSEEEKDETFVKVSKTPLAIGVRYHFYTTSGVSWGTSGSLGAQILSMGMSGGIRSVGNSQVHGQDNIVNPELAFAYYQEEKITVPPKAKVTAKMITSSVKIEQAYTLQFFISASRSVPIYYEGEPDCCGCGDNSKSGYVSAEELLRTLPNFRSQGGVAYFTQVGNLTWLGEKCTVDKTEERF